MHWSSQLEALDARLDRMLQVSSGGVSSVGSAESSIVVMRSEQMEPGVGMDDYLSTLETRQDTKLVRLSSSARFDRSDDISSVTKIPYPWVRSDKAYAKHLVRFSLEFFGHVYLVFSGGSCDLLLMSPVPLVVMKAGLTNIERRYSEWVPNPDRGGYSKMGPSLRGVDDTVLSDVTEACVPADLLTAFPIFQYGVQFTASAYNRFKRFEINGSRLVLVFNDAGRQETGYKKQSFILTFELPTQPVSGWLLTPPPGWD
jgi:hypothetical protein